MNIIERQQVMDPSELIKLRQKAKFLRGKMLDMVTQADSGHLASAFSMVELLVVLYGKVLNVDPEKPDWENRDRFILSKGHGCVALYAVLAEKGFFSVDILDSFCREGSILGGHPEMQKVPGIEASTGSLGHGLSIAAGISLAGKVDKAGYHIYCLMGDGECNEGSVWEAALFAAHHELENLIVIVDYNKLQASGPVDEILALHSLAAKWEAFGWEVAEIDGHDIIQILQTLKKIPFKKGRPSAIIAHTVKGKGVSFMENIARWHTMLPDEQELKRAKEELRSPEAIEAESRK
jgi:transketolase